MSKEEMGLRESVAQHGRKPYQKEKPFVVLQYLLKHTDENNVVMFISAVRKYTRARKLTPRMLNELIEKIEVHQAEKVDGVWQQKLTIHYHCVGVVSIPQALPLPMPDITMNTRKGVYVSYVPAEKAG